MMGRLAILGLKKRGGGLKFVGGQGRSQEFLLKRVSLRSPNSEGPGAEPLAGLRGGAPGVFL